MFPVSSVGISASGVSNTGRRSSLGADKGILLMSASVPMVILNDLLIVLVAFILGLRDAP